MTVYPIPGNGSFNCEFISEKNQPVRLSLVDLTGKKLFEYWQLCPAGKNVLPVLAVGLPGGFYLLELKAGEVNTYSRVAIANR